jgi:hypothetical protein
VPKPATALAGRRRSRTAAGARHEPRIPQRHSRFSSSTLARLPLVVSVVVVAIAALSMFG